MWVGVGVYTPQPPEILLFVVGAAFFTEFQKFLRVVNGHAKSDFWLQRLFFAPTLFRSIKGEKPLF